MSDRTQVMLVGVSCFSCNWSGGEILKSALAQRVREHLQNCPSRFYTDPLFGHHAVWQRTVRGDNTDMVQVGWASPGHGLLPLNIEFTELKLWA